MNAELDFGSIFARTHTVGVVGISNTPTRAGYYVPEYLAQQGFRILGVHPREESRVAAKTAPTLRQLGEPVDLVLLFRRSDSVGEHLEDVLTLQPRPSTVWMQQGIRNEEFAQALQVVGIEVVSDRCAMVEHRRL